MTDRRPQSPPPKLGAYRPVNDLGRQPRTQRSQGLRAYGDVEPRSRLASVALVSIAALAAIAAGLIAALYVFSPAGMVRDELVRQVRLQTGRTLAISGPTSISLWGGLSARMGDVTLSAPPGMSAPALLKVRELGAELALWPLFRGDVIVDRLVLHEPLIELHVDQSGRRSWDFAEAAAGPVRYAQAPAPRQGSRSDVPADLADFIANSSKDAKVVQAPVGRTRTSALAIGEANVRNATVRYSDARTGAAETATNIDLDVAGSSLAEPIEARGGGHWRGERIGIEGRVQSPAALLEGRSSRVVVAVATRHGEVRYNGGVTLAGSGPQADGAVQIDAPALRELARWLGDPLPEARGFSSLSLSGDLKASAGGVSLTRAALRLGEAKAEGSVAVELGGQRPMIRADLMVSGIDLDDFHGDDTASSPPPPARVQPPPVAKTTPPKGQSQGLTIEDLLRREGAGGADGGPRVKGYVRRTGWSEDPISAAALGAADVEARLSFAKLRIHRVAIDGAAARVEVKNRMMSATFEDVRLYSGRGRGLISIDGTNPALPRISLNVSADDVAAFPLLRDAGEFDWVEGKGRVQIALGGQGASEKAIVHSLNGRADFVFANGNIVGLDAGKILRGVSEGKFSGLERRPEEKTPFTELGASFKITAGTAETRDIRMLGPDVRLAGGGTSDLGARQLDMSLKPRLVRGEGRTDYEIPLRLAGSWDSPLLAPDFEAVRDIIKRPGVQESAKGILDAVQSGDGRAVKERAKDFFDKLLGR